MERLNCRFITHYSVLTQSRRSIVHVCNLRTNVLRRIRTVMQVCCVVYVTTDYIDLSNLYIYAPSHSLVQREFVYGCNRALWIASIVDDINFESNQ